MATEEQEPLKVQEFQFHEVPKTTKWENFQKALYDPDKGEYFGRTKKGWCQLLVFYSLFYACLAMLFAICMKGLSSTLSDTEPSRKLSDSLIGTNPGLGFRPISKRPEEGSLISYNLRDSESTGKWAGLIEEFLHSYKLPQRGANFQKCDYNNPPEEGNVCTVQVEDFGPCTAESYAGYVGYSPCVFLKLNRIYGWIPEFQTEVDEEMPQDLKDLIQSKNSNERNNVWISCEGENSFDKERIGGFKYYPSQGFPGYYFPYTNTKNYLSPLIAVQILNVEPGTIVNIECRAWAKNIRYNPSWNNREGSVHFEILVDTK